MAAGLQTRRNALRLLWEKGLAGRSLLRENTRIVDSQLAHWFTGCPDTTGMALVALGGYGRQELFPFSDIDLLLLYEEGAEERLDSLIEAVLYPLWNAGLEVGHSVRTVQQCLEDGAEDFFFQVALVDARLIVGSQTLFNTLQNRCRKVLVDGKRFDFLNKMSTQRKERIDRFGVHGFLLEPNIKEGRGGLRDIQTLSWTAKVILGMQQLSFLENTGILTIAEYYTFDRAAEHLVRIRNRLHYTCGRKNDQLFFEHQEEIAKALGHQSDGAMLAVERFMQDLYESMQTIAITTDLFLEHLHEISAVSAPGNAPQEKTDIEAGIEIRAGRIHLHDSTLLQKKPHMMMRAFTHAAKKDRELHYRTKKLIAANLHLINDRARKSRRMAKAFFEFLTAIRPDSVLLESLLETGLLTAYIPEFVPIESLAQHDIYHVYTVDRHLIQTVNELQDLARSSHRHIAVSDPRILFLSGLLHDIGKGTGSGHSQRGARLAKNVTARLGMPRRAAEDVAFLIKNHLFLSHIAQRRDLEDETMIMACAQKIKSRDRLKMLYLLTIADAKATGPTVWSQWKSTLLDQLYLKISHVIERPDLDTFQPDFPQATTWMRDKVQGLLEDAGLSFETRLLPDDYLLSFGPGEIVDHIRIRLKLAPGALHLEHKRDSAHWSILLVSTDRPGLLARICGVLALNNLQVLAAQIFTWDDGTVVDSIDVCPMLTHGYAEQDWQALEEDLRRAQETMEVFEHRLQKRIEPYEKKRPHGEHRSGVEVKIDNRTSEKYTIIEIYSTDRIGLLYDMAKTFADLGIPIYRAKIGSKADQVVDVFYVLDQNGAKLTDQPLLERIHSALARIAAS